ncbi:MAG: hypothetical protein IJM20_06995 [Clostridia bacterium]|nr:hypothetical protein [Clostridia bacterium]
MSAKRKMVIAGIIAAAAIFVMALYVFVISPKLIEPADTYSKAVKQYNDGDYVRSALMLESLGKYSDAQQLAKRAWKCAGDAAYDAGRYNEASACYVRGKSEEDIAKVDDCFIRLAREEFKALDPIKGEIYLGCVSEAADRNVLDSCRIEGARTIIAGTEDEDTLLAAVKLVEPCSEEKYPELSEMFAASGEAFLEKPSIDAAEAVFSGAIDFCAEDAFPALMARIRDAYSAAAQRAAEAGDSDTAERLAKFAEAYGRDAGTAEPTGDDPIETAAGLIENGDYVGAYAILSALPAGDAAAEPLLEEALFFFRRMPCAGANNAYIIVKMDGTVEFAGPGWTDTPAWSGVRTACMGYEAFALALRNDGTVVGAGVADNDRLNVSGWTGITKLAAGARHSLGLRTDGTVVSAGWNPYGQTAVSAWRNIIDIAAGKYTSYGVVRGGTVVAAGQNDYGQCEVGSWTDIVAVSAGRAHAVGLRSDGTVVACGDNAQGQCNVGSWSGIVMISASANHTVGLKADGTLVACGDNNNGQDEVSGITNAVAVSCGNGYTLVVLADGRVVVLGDVG